MDDLERNDILKKAKGFFIHSIAEHHAANTEKLKSLKEFKVNPFTVHYLASFAFGDDSPESLAKALIYPRALGTSISTTFGNQIQTFCHEVLSAYASTTSGMDIEFDDALDGQRKYCQLKAGPQTINKDDVDTITSHFVSLQHLARTNHLNNFNPMRDCCVGVLYGTHSSLSANYRRIERDYPVYIGKEFWLHLTGEPTFYNDLVQVFDSCASNYSHTQLLAETVRKLAEDIERHPEVLASDCQYEKVEF